MQRTILGNMQTVATCPSCEGQGEIPEKRCKHCNGVGRMRSESKYNVKIPAGISDGQAVKLVGKGESVGAGGQAGDLYVVAHVKADKEFERRDDDIYIDLHISYAQAALGDKVEINTVDGMKTMVIPEGTQSHQQIRLKNLGVPSLHGGGRGSQYVRVMVDVPKRVSRKARKMLEDLKSELE